MTTAPPDIRKRRRRALALGMAVVAAGAGLLSCWTGPSGFPTGRLEHAVLWRERCYGPCSDYRVAILPDGRVIYDGYYNVAVMGHHEGRATPQQMAAVVGAARAANLHRLRNEYFGGVMHGRKERVLVTVGGRTFVVRDYSGESGGMPQAVTTLKAAIDEAAGTSRWVEGDASTLPWLRAQGFDFGSERAWWMLYKVLPEGPQDLVLALIEGGALKIQEDKDRVLSRAAMFARAPLVAPLLKAGARIEAGDDGGATPLLLAARASQRNLGPNADGDPAGTVRALLAAGANPRARDQFGGTALHGAANGEVVALLVAAGADPEARTAEGSRVLLSIYDEGAALALLEAGARLDGGDARVFEARVAEARWSRVQAWLRANKR